MTEDDGDQAPQDVAPSEASSTGKDGEGEVICRDGLAACDGACVDLSSSDEHCGTCGHACARPSVYGHCEDGACPSAERCASVEQGFGTCHEVCAFHGQRCEEASSTPWRGCGGGYVLHFSELGNGALESCEKDIGPEHGVVASCTTPIDWSITGGWEDEPAGAVACCCSQEPAP